MNDRLTFVAKRMSELFKVRAVLELIAETIGYIGSGTRMAKY